MDKFPKNMNWFASRCPLLIRLLSLKLYLVRAPSIAEPNCSWWKDLLGINRSVLPSCQLTILAPSCGKLRRYTQRVEIGIVSYNQNYGLISLVTVNFFLNRHLPQSRISSSRLSSVRFMEKSFMTHNPIQSYYVYVCCLLWLNMRRWSFPQAHPCAIRLVPLVVGKFHWPGCRWALQLATRAKGAWKELTW